MLSVSLIKPVSIQKRQRCIASASKPASRKVATNAAKVAVMGAAGGIGQPLSLLLKGNKNISELALYDLFNVEGVAADLSHINTPVKVKGYAGADSLAACLSGAQLVIIPAGVPRKPGMTRDDLFNTNAGIVQKLVEAVAQYCPNAILNIITNPVNSTVPIAAETLKKVGKYDPRKVIGVTTLDVVRANTFVAEARSLDVNKVTVPVIGGHAGTTILPLLSQVTPAVSFSEAEKKAMTEKIYNAGTVVVEAKAGKGSATLSMAYAAARMAESTLLGLSGSAGVYECAFVQSDVVPGCAYFASKVELGPEGVKKVYGLGQLDAFEKKAMEDMLPDLQGQIKKGVEFVTKAK